MALPATGMLLLLGVTSGVTAAADPERGADATRGPQQGFVEGSPGTVRPGWTGPLVVAGFSIADDFSYDLEVTGPDGYSYTERFVLDEGESMREEVTLPPTTEPGSYSALLSNELGPVGTVAFTVGVPPRITLESAPAATFLPRVRDGVRDAVRMGFRLDRPAVVTGRVLDARGRVVRTVDLGHRGPGTVHHWWWSGHARGGVVERGTYRMVLLARSEDMTSRLARSVRVASYRATFDRRVDRRGTATSTRAPGDCRLTATDGGGLLVDCRDARRGGGAEVGYWFATGAAQGLRWKLTGEGTARRSARASGRGTRVTVRVPRGVRWRTDEVAVAWRTRVVR